MDVKRKFKVSLLENNPELAKEFDTKKNNTTADKVGSSERVLRYWICTTCGYSFQATVYKRNYLSRGCHCCTNKVCVPEINSLKAKRPDLAEEWHPTKNSPLTPESIVYGASLKVWWKCTTCSHEWEALVFKRSKYNQNCSLCNRGTNTSFPEQSIFYYLSKVFKETKNGYKMYNGVSVDILIEDYKIAIEYDGYNWHKDRYNGDKNKNYSLSEYLFIRVREYGLESIDDYGCINLFVEARNDSSLDNAITKIFDIISTQKELELSTPNVDVQKDRKLIMGLIKRRTKEKSFGELRPDLLKEWDYDENQGLDPYTLPIGSNEKVAWRCKEYGHRFSAMINVRTGFNGTGCPYCMNRLVLKGFNDLSTAEPLIAREWVSSTNNLKPTDVVFGSTEKVNWRCSDCNDTFTCSVSSRTSRATGQGCKTCNNGFFLVGMLINDEGLLGVRLFYKKRFLDISLDVLKITGLNINLTHAPKIEIRLFNGKWMTHMEYTKSIRVMEIKENDIKFFKIFSNHLFRNNMNIPVRTTENILLDSGLL